MVGDRTKAGELDAANAIRTRIKKYALSDEQLKMLRPVAFFGDAVDAGRVVFVVDFSGSMSQDARIVRLKKELDDSLAKIPAQVSYNVIYYSHRPWLGGESVGSAPFRDPEDARDRIPWLQANAENVANSREQLAEMDMGGATNWISPVRMALAMAPPPDVIFLMTDGEASDRKEMIAEMATINPNKVPIHTVGMEIGGPTFQSLIEIAEKTGGNFSIVMDGNLYSGEKARRFTDPKFAPKP